MSSAEPHGHSTSDGNFQTCYSTELGGLRTELVESPGNWFAKIHFFDSQKLP